PPGPGGIVGRMELQVSPRTEYERRRAARQADVNALRAVDDRVGSVGLWAATAAGVLLLVILLGFVPAVWILAPIVVLLIARIIHVRYDNRIQVLDAGVR